MEPLIVLQSIRIEDLRFQLRSLQEELRTYEGIGENLENLKRRYDESVEEIKKLKREKETRLLDEAMKEIFLERAADVNRVAQENSLLESQLSDNNQNCEDPIHELKRDNELLRATVLEQNLQIEHLRGRLTILNDRQRHKFGDVNPDDQGFVPGPNKF